MRRILAIEPSNLLWRVHGVIHVGVHGVVPEVHRILVKNACREPILDTTQSLQAV